jgi:hypothetical protein
MARRKRERLEMEETFPKGRQVTDAQKIMEKVVVLDIIFHRPTIRRKADLGLIDAAADKSMLGLTKALVESKEYTEVCHVANETRSWLERRTLPSPLRRGTYLLPLTMVEAVNDKLDEVEKDFLAKAEKFLDAYPALTEAARVKLMDQFDPANYPSVNALRVAFSLERRLLDFGVPGEEKIGKALWQKEKERAEKTWIAAVDDIQDALRAAFRGLVGHLSERLEPNVDGSKKCFKDSAINKLLEFIDLFKNRNLTGDAELEGLVAQARNVLEGKSPKKIRDRATTRGEVAGEMARVMGALDKLLENSPRRKISFEDE